VIVAFGMAPAGADSLRRVLDSVFAAPAYAWVEKAKPLGFLLRWINAITRWLQGLEGGHPGLFTLLLSVLVVALVAVFVHAGWLFVTSIRAAQAPPAGAGRETAAALTPEGLRREADRLAAAGRFVEAMQADFLGLALELDRRSLLRFHPSKTPAELAGEARLGEDGRRRLGALVGSLYTHAFARVPVGPAEYAAWRAEIGAGLHAAA
jgi:hypothetical protein